MKTLSICIPSYDRFEKLQETIEGILTSESNDFEVVIVDNCSPRNIHEYLKEAESDSRVRIVERTRAVYGAKNVGDAIAFAESTFALLLLDKDTVDGRHLKKFINYLRNHNNIAGGYCQLNSMRDEVITYDQYEVSEFGYLSKHPSGDFYRIDLLRDYMEDKEKELEKDPFPFDIYLAYCASKGQMVYYNSPLVFSDLNNPKVKDSGTLTFKKSQGNIYYFADNRIQEFKKYAECLFELDMPKVNKLITLGRVYVATIVNVTIGLKRTMVNPQVCMHYGHDPEIVTIKEMVNNTIKLRKAFYSLRRRGVSKIELQSIELKAMYYILKKVARKATMKVTGKNGE